MRQSPIWLRTLAGSLCQADGMSRLDYFEACFESRQRVSYRFRTFAYVCCIDSWGRGDGACDFGGIVIARAAALVTGAVIKSLLV